VTDLKNIVDPLDRPIWGARAFGDVINKNESQTFYLLGKKRADGTPLLDADRVNGQYVSTPRRLLNSLQAEDLATEGK
jgi:hypothetical protein